VQVPRERLKLRDNRRLLSPPIVAAPLYRCSSIVVLRGFVPDATLDVEIAGAIVLNNVPGGFPEPTARS
jgi:hypothetical protein